jgi:hypothetical protein
VNTPPWVESMYNINDGIFAVLYFTKGTASISSFTAAFRYYNFFLLFNVKLVMVPSIKAGIIANKKVLLYPRTLLL